MEILKAVQDFAGIVEKIWAEVAEVDAKIMTLTGQRQQVELAKPHTDDIVAFFLRQANAFEDTFERQLAARLNDTFVTNDSAAAAADKGHGFDLLRLEASKPSIDTMRDRRIRGEKVEINPAVLFFFLGDKIKGEIPGLVDRLCPQARKGMKSADRKAALAAIDRQLAELRAKREELTSNLQAGRDAVLNPARLASPTHTG